MADDRVNWYFERPHFLLLLWLSLQSYWRLFCYQPFTPEPLLLLLPRGSERIRITFALLAGDWNCTRTTRLRRLR